METQSTIDWPVANPFVQRRIAVQDDIDGFGHVNNVRYIDWALDVAWAHSEALGFSIDEYHRVGVGCVVWRHEFDYVSPIVEGEETLIATWIANNDGRVRMTRAFEMRRADNGKVFFKGQTRFVTVDMKTGKPARMPASFVAAYKPTA